jgi:(4S)-4-hydroxy-5-phosphonooxypentane-2,3-dione isomerase
MHVVLVNIHVKPELVDDFIQASLENARNSNHEPGIARFDFLQQGDDPTHFILVEVYRTPADQQKHRETPHYMAWKDRVGDMMAEPRVGIRYQNLYPDDRGWG